MSRILTMVNKLNETNLLFLTEVFTISAYYIKVNGYWCLFEEDSVVDGRTAR